MILPLVGRRLPIIADEHVDLEFGTGALKITPGHDPDDFEIGRRHGLEEISVIGEDGRMTAAAGERFEGMTAAEARDAVVAALRDEGRLRGEEPYTHSVPFSERSGERIEPLISLQWFCRMDELAAPAIEVVERDEVRIVPENYKRVYLNWMREIRPWCVSRQLWWGHQIPVWYGPEGEEIVAESAELAREAAAEQGIDPDSLSRETDVLDTWFSSALWPFATLGWPEETPHLRAFYPTSFLTTAREIIFLWVARMVMMGIEFAGEIPFRDVYVHPVIQAPDGRRMSKSLGTGIDPLDEIDVHGADALRFGLLAISSTQDVRYSPERVQQGRDLANKMWNASRLILLNAGDARPAPRTERLEDRWILPGSTRLSPGSRRASRATTSPTRCSTSTRSSGRSSATGTWRSSSRASTTATRTRPRTCCTCSSRCCAGPPGDAVRDRGDLGLSARPRGDADRLAEAVPGPVAGRHRGRGGGRAAIEQVREVRRWRDLVGVPAAAVLEARIEGELPEFVARLARLQRRRPGASRSRRSARSRSSPRARSTPRRPRADRGRARAPARRDRAPRAQARQRGLRRQGAGRGGRGRAREARRLPRRARPSWDSP